MRALIGIAIGLLFAFVIAPVHATTIYQVERTCPVGGEKFKSFGIGSTSSFGVRLDLRPGGPAAHLPTPECPNGFVIYKEEADFTADEIAKLTPVVASAEYQRMRTEHVMAYRIAYLRRAAGEPEKDLGWTLMRAAFEAEDSQKEDLRQKYLGEARTAYEALRAANTGHNDPWWTSGLLLAEIARQQSRFDDAIAAVDALPLSEAPADSMIAEAARQIRAKAVAHDPKPAQFVPPGEH